MKTNTLNAIALVKLLLIIKLFVKNKKLSILGVVTYLYVPVSLLSE